MSLLELLQLFEISTQTLVRSFSPLHVHRNFPLLWNSRHSISGSKQNDNKQTSLPWLEQLSHNKSQGEQTYWNALGQITQDNQPELLNRLFMAVYKHKITQTSLVRFNQRHWFFQLLFPSTCRFLISDWFQPLRLRWEVAIGPSMGATRRSSWSKAARTTSIKSTRINRRTKLSFNSLQSNHKEKTQNNADCPTFVASSALNVRLWLFVFKKLFSPLPLLRFSRGHSETGDVLTDGQAALLSCLTHLDPVPSLQRECSYCQLNTTARST